MLHGPLVGVVSSRLLSIGDRQLFWFSNEDFKQKILTIFIIHVHMHII